MAAVPTSSVSKNLLRLLRSPETVIEQIDEHISLDDSEFTRTVTLRLRSSSAGQRILVDLLRPAKGRLVRLEVLTGDARRVGHAEHLAVSRQLIAKRWTSFVGRVDADRLATADRTDLAKSLLEAGEDLVRLPMLSPEDAQVLMEKWWVPQDSHPSSPPILLPLKGRDVSVDVQRMRRLYLLCTELSQRYLLLAEVSAPTGQSLDLSYRYHQRISDSPESRGVLSRVKFVRSVIRGLAGAMPPTLRIHVPLAKRANHYALVVDAPDDYFIRRAVLSRALTPTEPRRRGQTTQRVDSSVQWSSSLGHGRRLMMFVGEGTDFGPRAFTVADLMEMPARSTFREWTASAIQSTVCGGLLVVGLVGGSSSSDTAALVVAIVSVIFASTRDALPNKSVLGAPVRSRIAGLASPLLAGLFAVWLVSLGVVERPLASAIPEWFAPHLVWLARAWVDYGGFLVVGLMVVMTIALSVRGIETIREHALALRGERDHTALYPTSQASPPAVRNESRS